MLQARVNELTADVHKWQDLFTEKATGRRLYEPVEEKLEPQEVRPPETASDNPIVRARRALGGKAKPRDIVNYLQNENNEEFAVATRTTGPPDVPEDMKTAVAEGQQQAIQ